MFFFAFWPRILNATGLLIYLHRFTYARRCNCLDVKDDLTAVKKSAPGFRDVLNAENRVKGMHEIQDP